MLSQGLDWWAVRLQGDSVALELLSLAADISGMTMAVLTIRKVPDEVHRALRLRAVQHGRSTEAEVREILALAVRSQRQAGLGSRMAEIGRRVGENEADAGYRRSGPRNATTPNAAWPWRFRYRTSPPATPG